MTTTISMLNNNKDPVLVYITLGATPGCCQDVANITTSSGVTITKIADLMGSFTLLPQQTTEFSVPAPQGLNGNFSFGTPPLNCPTPDFPEGVNLAEFIINNGFQVNGQETVDISCVCGANAFVEFQLSTDDWNDGTNWGIRDIKNKTRFDNTGISGVYPYSCDNCTASTNPPVCIGQHPQFANTSPICNVQRPSGNNKGGKILVIFHGMTPVPL